MSEGWWTCSQSVRTACQLPIVIDLLETESAPPYQRIVLQVKHLRGLGLPWTAIASALGVTDKTVKKAATWAPGDE